MLHISNSGLNECVHNDHDNYWHSPLVFCLPFCSSPVRPQSVPCMLPSTSPPWLTLSLRSMYLLTWKTSGWLDGCADAGWTCCSLELDRWWGCWLCHCGQTPTPSAVRVWNCPEVCPLSGARNVVKDKQLESINFNGGKKPAHSYIKLSNFIYDTFCPSSC